MLLRYSILISIITILCFFCSYVQAQDNAHDIETFDTSEDVSEETEDDTSHNQLPPKMIPNSSDQSELKTCMQGKIIALNKITAVSKELTLKAGESKYFGNIEIKLHKCVKNLDPYAEDNLILLTVTEHKIDEDPALVFQGWIMSSSISLSTFEHPIYEIFAKECLSE